MSAPLPTLRFRIPIHNGEGATLLVHWRESSWVAWDCAGERKSAHTAGKQIRESCCVGVASRPSGCLM